MTNQETSTPAQDGDADAIWTVIATSDVGDDTGLHVPVVFRSQPHPLEARHRVVFRTALLVLVLGFFNQGAARLENVHLMMWAMRSARTRRLLMAWWHGRRFVGTVTVRTDPGLDITINLARVDGLIEAAGSNLQRLRLTTKGRALFDLIGTDGRLLEEEKRFLASLGSLSDAAVDRHVGRDRE